MEEIRCPGKIVVDSGVAFGLGLILGGTFHALKGYRTFPKRRLFGMFQGVRYNAPRIGGNFAAWGTLFATSECTLNALRHMDDSPINRIAAGATTSALLVMRGGKGSMLRGALIGGVLLTCIELVSYFMGRSMPADPLLYMSEEEQLKVIKQQEEQAARRARAQAHLVAQTQ